jgi:hypothetical protein
MELQCHHAFINALATIAMAAAHGSCERVAQAIGGGNGVLWKGALAIGGRDSWSCPGYCDQCKFPPPPPPLIAIGW